MAEKRQTPDIIDINGERYKKLKSMNPMEKILAIFVEYLEDIDLKKATPEEIRILTDVAEIFIKLGVY